MSVFCHTVGLARFTCIYYINAKTNQPRVVTLVADKLETVVRRGSETNCIRELERMMVQIIYNHSCVIRRRGSRLIALGNLRG